jgi:hypothetical protein
LLWRGTERHQNWRGAICFDWGLAEPAGARRGGRHTSGRRRHFQIPRCGNADTGTHLWASRSDFRKPQRRRLSRRTIVYVVTTVRWRHLPGERTHPQSTVSERPACALPYVRRAYATGTPKANSRHRAPVLLRATTRHVPLSSARGNTFANRRL